MLKEVDIGGMVDRDGDKVYTHVAWADEVRALTDALDDANGYLIPQVRWNLPLTIRMIIPSGQATWHKFLEDVAAISMDRLTDHQEYEARMTQQIMSNGGYQHPSNSITTLAARFANSQLHSPSHPAPAYSPAPLQRGFGGTTTPQQPATPTTIRQAPPHLPALLTPRTPSTPQTPVNRFNIRPLESPNPFASGSTLHNSPIFGGKTTHPPVPQTLSPASIRPNNIELANRAVAASSTFANKPEGVAAYNAAIQAWEGVYPPGREVDFTTAPYPLTPGTANIGSRECFACAQRGHITRECAADTVKINNREQRWHAFIGRQLFGFRPVSRSDTIGISQISTAVEFNDTPLPYDPAIYDAGQLDFEDDYEQQGNGQENHE
ncbi:hypothetical protein CVT25_004442 [Psilocybe cyanescens]|uniref:CCHC-type domain-containing protein n=1 Tax=Psilocybe cyanescens TaxID=93625 RepID=A0A409XMM6_PSICY|nr:hypothetical protein CVT25_004442 [Psilocybe cyanescens]